MSSAASSSSSSSPLPALVDRRIGACLGQLVPHPVASKEPPALSAALNGPPPTLQYGGLLAGRALEEQGVTHVFTLTGGHVRKQKDKKGGGERYHPVDTVLTHVCRSVCVF